MVFIKLYNLLIPTAIRRITLFLFLVFFPWCIIVGHFSYAQNHQRKIMISYENNLLDISTKDAELKKVLLNLENKTNIDIYYPDSLQKNITMHKQEISLKNALECLLKDFDHLIIYSGQNKKNASISKVFILKESKKSQLQMRNERRLSSRINNYKKQIESLRKNLLRVGENSRQGKRYLKRIKAIERNIRRLEQQLY